MQGLGLPASTRARLAWRTPAMSAAQSLFAGMPYSFSALARANQFLAWHHHLANRFHTVSGALPTPVKFDSEFEADDFPGVAGFDLGPLGENLGLRVGLFANISPLSPRGSVRAAPFRASPPFETRPGEGFERSTIEVEPLRRIDPATDASTPALARSVREARPVEAEAAAAEVFQPARQAASEAVMPGLPLFWPMPQFPHARAESQPRLKLSVSFVPRREVRDFYRHAEAPVAGTVIAETADAKEIPRAGTNAISTPGWEAARQAIASAAVQMSRPGSPTKDVEAEKPAAQRDGIPIFASPLHLLTRSEVEARNQRRIAEENEKAGRHTASAPPPPPAAPPLDINAVAEKVSDILARRQQFERERKG